MNPPRSSTTNLNEQVVEIVTRLQQMAEDIAEIKALILQVEQRVRTLEQSDTGTHPMLDSKISAAWRKIDEHDRSIERLGEAIVEIKQTNKIMAWVGGGTIGSAVLVYITTQLLNMVK